MNHDPDRDIESQTTAPKHAPKRRPRVRNLDRKVQLRKERERDGTPQQQNEPQQNEEGAGTDSPRKRSALKRHPYLFAGAGVIVLALIIGGIVWWLNARNYESTDDAFVDTHIVRVAPQTAGQIARVAVSDNELVKAGDLLVELDTAQPQSQVAQVTAQQAAAQSQLAQAQAKLAQIGASHQQALASAQAARAQADAAQSDLARYEKLQQLNAEAVAQQQIDQARANARNMEAQYRAATKQAQSIAAQRQAAEAEIKGAEAQVRALSAQVTSAKTTLGYARIVAPIAGHIAQRNVAIGDYVTAGQQLMAIVPLTMWVTANFKETQLAGMHAGQPADITIDACPGADIKGHLDSIQRGSGQAFALLPPENATGNFVKVVQRVPVKIDLDSVPASCPLGPGVSAVVTVKVR